MFTKYITFSALLLALIVGAGCNEIAPVITPGDDGGPTGPPPTVENQMRQAIIEEFTGVRCVNCPAGSEAIEQLLNAHDEQLVAVSIHAGFFAVDYDESDANLKTETGTSVLSLLGEPLGYPTAVINRKRFDGEENRQVGQGTWPGYIAEELIGEPEVKIDIIPTFDDASGELDVKVDLYVQEDIAASDVRVTVYLTESNISDPQLTPDGTNYEYIHKHVLRTSLSPFDGKPLNQELTAGSVINTQFNIELDASWVPEECSIVAFVHQGGATLDVYQAHEVKMVE